MRIILPMAGHGKRFVDAGYTEDKPLITLQGKTLLEWSLSCIPPEWERYFVVRRDQPCSKFLQCVNRLNPFSSWVILPGSTQGAAMTVLSAAMALPPDEPVAAMNCDQWFCWHNDDLNTIVKEAISEKWDGFILTFPGTGPSWSYAITDEKDRVVYVVEKKQVSPHATVGFYWWRRAKDLVKSICQMIGADQRVKGEFYLAPSFNFMPLDSKDVRIVPVSKFVGLGTPEQLDTAKIDHLLPQEGV